jgi:hypothetical protein
MADGLGVTQDVVREMKYCCLGMALNDGRLSRGTDERDVGPTPLYNPVTCPAQHLGTLFDTDDVTRLTYGKLQGLKTQSSATTHIHHGVTWYQAKLFDGHLPNWLKSRQFIVINRSTVTILIQRHLAVLAVMGLVHVYLCGVRLA